MVVRVTIWSPQANHLVRLLEVIHKRTINIETQPIKRKRVKKVRVRRTYVFLTSISIKARYVPLLNLHCHADNFFFFFLKKTIKYYWLHVEHFFLFS